VPNILCDSPKKWLQMSWSRGLVLYASCRSRNMSTTILIIERIRFIPRIGRGIFPAFAVWGRRSLQLPGRSRPLRLNQNVRPRSSQITAEYQPHGYWCLLSCGKCVQLGSWKVTGKECLHLKNTWSCTST